MNKKLYLKTILKVSLISLLTIQHACMFSGMFGSYTAFNCYKIGYKQDIHSPFFDKKDSKLYFVYSYLDKKDSKFYSLYRIDLNGKVEKILDLGSRPYSSKNKARAYSSKNKGGVEQSIADLKYDFKILLNNNDRILLEEKVSNQTTIINHTYPYSYLYYDIDFKSKNIMVYKKETLLNSYSFTKENKNLFNPASNEIAIFNIEKGTYYNNTIPHSYEDSIKWVNANTIMKVTEGGIVSIYELKDNNITKTFEYNMKPNEKNLFLTITPENYINNTLSFYSYSKETKNNSQDLYNLDFNSNSLSLVKSNLINNPTNNEPNILLRVSKKMYFYDYDTKKELIFDYLNELPKSFYNDETVCGQLTPYEDNNSLFVRELILSYKDINE